MWCIYVNNGSRINIWVQHRDYTTMYSCPQPHTNQLVHAIIYLAVHTAGCMYIFPMQNGKGVHEIHGDIITEVQSCGYACTLQIISCHDKQCEKDIKMLLSYIMCSDGCGNTVNTYLWGHSTKMMSDIFEVKLQWPGSPQDQWASEGSRLVTHTHIKPTIITLDTHEHISSITRKYTWDYIIVSVKGAHCSSVTIPASRHPRGGQQWL